MSNRAIMRVSSFNQVNWNRVKSYTVPTEVLIAYVLFMS